MSSSRVTSFSNDALTFDVVDEGPLDGDLVVLLHGFPERASSWRGVTALLNAAGYRTIAPDQRGYSPGARPRRRRDYAMPRLAQDVVALIDTLAAPVHLVGHDWGSAVAWTVAAHHPDMIRTLTAISVPHPEAFLRAMRGRQLVRSVYMGAFQLPKVPELLARRTGGVMDRAMRARGMKPDEVARFRTEIVEDGALPGGLGWYRGLPFSRQSCPAVRVPTTMVWSDGDGFIDEAGVRFCADYVEAPYELVVLEGATHWLPSQNPDDVAAIVRRRVEGSPATVQ
ncbi:alpha/beta fold hydrolase [Dermacoccus abyssi]|uniref:Alpha/beta fold hydrolase n=1 Tax=Dermacoccus abyssi TaxID=322596 RepID=A0ABX5Z8N2_9MICO|nr:alpha/beta fold hydrolase [Dermacoccus abyssi]